MGGCVRDLLRGVEPADWDMTTNARPEQVVALFPGALYENRFGTVEIDVEGGAYQVTTYRHDGAYSDHRRPDEVIFGERLDDDLARRDFTVNAMALAVDEVERGAGPTADGDGGTAPGRSTEITTQITVDATAIHDPFGGRDDLAAGSSAPSATRPRDSARMPSGCCAPPGSRPRSGSASIH